MGLGKRQGTQYSSFSKIAVYLLSMLSNLLLVLTGTCYRPLGRGQAMATVTEESDNSS